MSNARAQLCRHHGRPLIGSVTFLQPPPIDSGCLIFVCKSSMKHAESMSESELATEDET